MQQLFTNLEIAQRDDARFLLTSTSECYGDPLEHPQKETYWGNVNPVGERSCYDESKRYAEAVTMAFHRKFGVKTNIARIFNTYGPRTNSSLLIDSTARSCALSPAVSPICSLSCTRSPRYCSIARRTFS